MKSDVWLYGFYAVVILFQVAAVPALILKKNDLADVLWGPAFPLSAMVAAYRGANGLFYFDFRTGLIFTLISIWALRLFIHLGRRNLTHRTEDVRYSNWRRQWGRNWLWRSYFQVFVLQALILYVFLTPILLAIASPQEPMSWLGWAGAMTWVAGFFFETVADEQLRRFKSLTSNKGILMAQGLWSWSRHPNYFGEVIQWWGIWLIVLDLPFGWATVVSPLGFTFLILRVSGVSMLEDLMKNRPGYKEYANRTSKFIPMPPSKKLRS